MKAIKNKQITPIFLMIALTFWWVLPLFAQQKPQIRLKTSVEANQIKLRWAVDEPLAWRKTTDRTFVLERYTLLRSGEFLETPQRTLLGEFKVPELARWQQKIEENDYAAIIAQALFGETFDTNFSKNANPIEGIFNKSQEIQQRFSFALMAADLDFEVACFTGWGFVDTQVQPDEKYLYKIFLKEDATKKPLVLKEGLSVADASQKADLPPPSEFLVLFKDKKALISWNYTLLQDVYNAYFIERSDDGGKTFSQISSLPVSSLQQTQNPTPYTLYQDSLPQNNQTYQYRLRGKTIFGDYGAYSEVLAGEGKATVNNAAQIVFSDIAQDETILLRWEFPQAEERNVKHFELLYAPENNEQAFVSIRSGITPSDRSIVVKSRTPSNYFKIRTVSVSDESAESFPVLVQPADDTPPQQVQELKGVIDTLGLVHLSWKPNSETDLEGYHIFRKEKENEEMTRITPQAIWQHSLVDTVQLANLNDKVWYYVTATDIRKNQSAPSQLLMLVKPDKVIPVAPLFKEVTTDNLGRIVLRWEKSFSDDAESYHLFREAEGTWHEIGKVRSVKDKEVYEYQDDKVKAGETYAYMIKVQDRSGLWSNPSPVVRQKSALPAKYNRGVHRLRGRQHSKGISLQWEAAHPNLAYVDIYKKVDGGQPSLWRSLKKGVTQTDDQPLESNTVEYIFRPVTTDNKVLKAETLKLTRQN
ncbi:fibronectin type III domain-containing protein [Capnocytophaga sp.]|uniref:fibronectin type III domain-containing protein n=1 Tax=Capnocytophaga sp. TaxID=44737 RepID=UPI0026DBFBFD|nr:hypothetical protein [Capnocytophaga sp.]MDO5106413.1 hypothetical protein [Capnocytophaga sp.]